MSGYRDKHIRIDELFNIMLNLSSNVILVALGSTKITETIKAIRHCQKLVTFYDTIYLTDHIIDEENIRHIPVRNIPSIKDYQKFIINESPDIILSSVPDTFNGHFLCINWDGFIINSESWTNEFLEYDYIGAPWPWYDHKAGNGGFCLKSSKFMRLQKQICRNHKTKHNEDEELCIVLRSIFEGYNCKYAHKELAYLFSTEVGDIEKNRSFGFHDFKYHPQLRSNIE